MTNLPPKSGLYQHYKGRYYRYLFAATIVSELEHKVQVASLLQATLSEWPTWQAGVHLNWSNGRIEACLLNYPEVAKLYPAESSVAVYASLQTRRFWLRPLDMFQEEVQWPDGKMRPRFLFLQSQEDDPYLVPYDLRP